MKRKLLALGAVSILVLAAAVLAYTASREIDGDYLFPFVIDEGTPDAKWGYKDGQGNVVIKPRFFEASEFNEGLASVSAMRSGRSGYINTRGNFVIRPRFELAYDFINGIALVARSSREGLKFSYIDRTGRVLFGGKEWDVATDFSEGFAVVMIRGYVGIDVPDEIRQLHNRFSFINTQGNLTTEMEYEQARLFENGFALVRNNGKWGMINTDFELVVDYVFDNHWDVVPPTVEP
jgi:hypothetical protein